jgi:glycosyltransferase involved in cell wall biosynthesis
MPTRTAGVLNDNEFDVAPDGSFELVIGGQPRERAWLPLSAEASRVTVRHYWERVTPPATPPAPSLDLSIELIDGDVPAAPLPPNDHTIAAAIRRLADDREDCADMGRRGRAWVLANATRRALSERYLRILEEMAA